MRKNKNFQIIVELQNNATMFETANSEREAERILDSYTKGNQTRKIHVYELDATTNSYALTQTLCHKSEVAEPRLIGFGRW